MADQKVYMQAEVKFRNRKAMRAALRVAELASEIAEDYPWSDEAREMVKAASYLLRNVTVEVKRDTSR